MFSCTHYINKCLNMLPKFIVMWSWFFIMTLYVTNASWSIHARQYIRKHTWSLKEWKASRYYECFKNICIRNVFLLRGVYLCHERCKWEMEHRGDQYSMIMFNVNCFAVMSVRLDWIPNNNCLLHFDWVIDISSELTTSILSF